MAEQGAPFVRPLVQYLADGGQAKPEFAEHENALQTNQRPLVVVPVAVASGATGFQQPDGAVIAQRATGRQSAKKSSRSSRTLSTSRASVCTFRGTKATATAPGRATQRLR